MRMRKGSETRTGRGTVFFGGLLRRCLFCLLLALVPPVLAGCDPMGLGQGYVVLKNDWYQERERMKTIKQQRREEKRLRKEERIAARCARNPAY